jgi:hypothetical protein
MASELGDAGAFVEHGDMLGTAAADFDTGFHGFAESFGVDVNRYFPVAMSIHTDDGKLSVTIYAADGQRVGSTREEVERYAKEHGGRLPTVALEIRATIPNVLDALGRFAVVLRLRSNEFGTIEYTE